MNPKFTDRGYQEILKARARLNNTKVKDYGYPLETPNIEQVSQESEQPEEPWIKKQWDIINQLRGMVKFLYSKETERRANASKRRPKSKY